MLEAKLAPHKTRPHPLPPRHTRHTDPMLPQPLRKHGRLDGMRAKQKVKQPVLDPDPGFEGSGGAREDVVVQRGAGGNDFAPRGERHDEAADEYGFEVGSRRGDVGVVEVFSGGHD